MDLTDDWMDVSFWTHFWGVPGLPSRIAPYSSAAAVDLRTVTGSLEAHTRAILGTRRHVFGRCANRPLVDSDPKTIRGFRSKNDSWIQRVLESWFRNDDDTKMESSPGLDRTQPIHYDGLVGVLRHRRGQKSLIGWV